MPKQKLYEVRVHNPRTDMQEVDYGHKLAVDSTGNWVMEIIGQNPRIVSVAKDNVEEVLPHTISVAFKDNGTHYAYFAEKDKYQVGDLFILDSTHGRQIVEIVAVDTKAARATKDFKPKAKLIIEGVLND